MWQGLSWQSLVARLGDLWSAVRDEIAPEGIFTRETALEIVRLSRPIEPFNQPDFIAPLIGLGGLLLGLVLAGVALSSLGALLTALLALALLLTQVYGIRLELGAISQP